MISSQEIKDLTENLTQISVVLALFTSNEMSNDYESVKCSTNTKEIEQNLLQG